MRHSSQVAALSGLIALLVGPLAHGLDIRVLGDTSSNGMIASGQLEALGHTINANGSDLTGYDQVWDLRSDTVPSGDEFNAISAYVAGGGPVLLTGDNSAITGAVDRNDALISLVQQLGGGTIASQGGVSSSTELISAAGQVVNFPNILNTISYGSAELFAPDPAQGFLVSISQADPGTGAMLGWDFGELDNALTSRMLIAFDNEFFELTGQNWTENMVSYLATPFPEPSAAIFLLGGSMLAVRRRSRRAR